MSVDQATARSRTPASTSRSARPWTPPRPRASSPRRTPARAGSRRHAGDDQPEQRPGHRRARCRGQAARPGGRASCAPPDSATSNPARARRMRPPATRARPRARTRAAGTVVNRNAAITVALQPRQVRLVRADSAPSTALTALAAVGAVGARRRGLGHRHRALPVHGARARSAHPPGGRRAPPRAAPLRRPHGAVAAPQAAVDGRAGRSAGDPTSSSTRATTSGTRDGLRGLRAALDPLRGIPGVFVHGSNDHAAPSPRNPLRYFTGPSNVKHARASRWTPQALDGYLTDELGWLDLNNAVGSLEVAGLRVDAFGVSDAHRGWDQLDVLPGPPASDLQADVAPAARHASASPTRRTVACSTPSSISAPT